MATVTAKGTVSSVSGNISIIKGPSLVNLDYAANCQVGAGLIAGEAIKPFAPCYILNTDGKVYNAQAVSGKNRVVGFAAEQVFAAGDPVTLLKDVDVDYIASSYSTSTSAGAPIYLSATVGLLDDAITTTYGTLPIAYFVPSSNSASPTTTSIIRVYGSMNAF